jgi:hypothetical protein
MTACRSGRLNSKRSSRNRAPSRKHRDWPQGAREIKMDFVNPTRRCCATCKHFRAAPPAFLRMSFLSAEVDGDVGYLARTRDAHRAAASHSHAGASDQGADHRRNVQFEVASADHVSGKRFDASKSEMAAMSQAASAAVTASPRCGQQLPKPVGSRAGKCNERRGRCRHDERQSDQAGSPV